LIYVFAFMAGALSNELPSNDIIFLILFNTMLVGFSEEVMFRGVLLQGALSRFSIWPAIIFVSVAFGMVHSLNAFITGEVTSAIIQSVAAFMTGFYFMAIRVRSGSLIPGILLHWFYDFSIFMMVYKEAGASKLVEQTPQLDTLPQILPILMVIPLFLYGFYLLRNVKQDINGIKSQ